MNHNYVLPSVLMGALIIGGIGIGLAIRAEEVRRLRRRLSDALTMLHVQPVRPTRPHWMNN